MAKATTARPKKRANGTGSIYRNGDRWRVAIPYTDAVTGETRHKVLTAKTREQAEAMLVDNVRARDAGMDLTSVTLEVFLERWLKTQRLRVRPSTAMAHESHVRLYLVPALGKIPVGKVSPNDVERMMARMIERGLSARTARHARTTLRKALGTAERDGLVSRNPAASVELPRLRHREMTALTREETARLIATCVQADSVFGDVVIVSVTTGLRQGETLGLSWSDVTLEPDPSLEIRNSLARTHEGGFELGETKTAQSRRHVDLSPDAAAAIHRQRLRQLESRLQAGTTWRETGLVFTDEVGQWLKGWNVTHAFHGLSKHAGIRDCRFHDLRHTAATLWLQAGVGLKTVSEALGHTSIAITADVYGKVSPVQRRELADIMTSVAAEGRQL